MEKERWLPIPWYEGVYEVSNLGRVRSLNLMRREKNEGLMKISVHKGTGYRLVFFSKNNHNIAHRVARLVARAFIKNPENKPQVNHKDFNRQNDCVENLEWVTASENLLHAHTKKSRKKPDHQGSKHPYAKLTEKDVREIRKAKKYYGYLFDLSEKYGIARNYICMIRDKQNWKHITD